MNPGAACATYRISSADPSTTWVHLHSVLYSSRKVIFLQAFPKNCFIIFLSNPFDLSYAKTAVNHAPFAAALSLFVIHPVFCWKIVLRACHLPAHCFSNRTAFPAFSLPPAPLPSPENPLKSDCSRLRDHLHQKNR